MCSGADQPNRSIFHVRQEDILLGFVETMNLVDKQERWLAGIGQPIGRDRQHAPHLGHIRLDATEPLEFVFRLLSNDLGQGSFARARRTVKNERLNAVGFDGAPEKLARGQNMCLADKFVEGPRTHPCGQRGALGWLGGDGGGWLGWRGLCCYVKEIVPRHCSEHSRFLVRSETKRTPP